MELSLRNAIENAAVKSHNFHYVAVNQSGSISEYFPSIFNKIYEYIVLSPLARLYLYGPSWGTFGFWNGMDTTIICSQKTQLSSSFWEEHPHECLQLISKHFYGTVVLFETIVYFTVVYLTLKYIFTFCYHCRILKKNT